ncbi:MAG: hypothetical protein GY833_12175 [Aestuariibacter sp.]|nr:hypothetical protein [Aestuariibacter sp.]|tara:strand:+ start:22917 stop:23297 length:381 start_codon:yes stop_codon:yes gene_type:complete
MNNAVSRALHALDGSLFSIRESALNELDSSRNKAIAETILKQLRTLDKWALGSWAARDFIAIDSGIQFRVRGTKVKVGGMVQITLNGRDLYDIKLLTIRGVNVKTKAEVNDIFVDSLVDALDSVIG